MILNIFMDLKLQKMQTNDIQIKEKSIYINIQVDKKTYLLISIVFFTPWHQKLQNAAQDLQSSAGDVLGAFKPLIERLEPLATNVIKSEARQLSRDVLLLIEAMSAKKKSLQVRK